jgi:hypothetical protein
MEKALVRRGDRGRRRAEYGQFYFVLFCLTHAFLFYPEKHLLLMIEFKIAKMEEWGRWILTFRDRSFVLMTAHMVGDQRCDNYNYYYYIFFWG